MSSHSGPWGKCVWRSRSFRHFCLLSCLLWGTWNCHSTFSCNKHDPFLRTPFLSFLWLFDSMPAGQFAHCVISSMCFVTKKGVRWDYPCCHHLLDLLSVSIQKRKNQYCFVGSCLVPTVFSSRTDYTERTNYKPQRGSEALVARRKGSWRVKGSVWVGIVQSSYILMMRDYQEDLDDFPTLSARNTNKQAESLVGSYRAESTDGQLHVEQLRIFLHFWMGQLLGSSMKRWLMIGWTFNLLEAEERGPAL